MPCTRVLRMVSLTQGTAVASAGRWWIQGGWGYAIILQGKNMVFDKVVFF